MAVGASFLVRETLVLVFFRAFFRLSRGFRDAFDQLGDAPHRREFGDVRVDAHECSHRRRQLHRGDAVHADVRQRVAPRPTTRRHLRRRKFQPTTRDVDRSAAKTTIRRFGPRRRL